MIRQLEPHLINQIAAGEVVERPASVIKELIENALDAGATQVTIYVRQGGQSLLRVEDNGHGMSDEDLILAVQRHTTSKLPKGLERICTFGFRGEALAAIASIARLTLASRTQGQSHGWALMLEGGNVIEKKPLSLDVGTCVEVRDLFFATPARLKFMRSPSVEQSHILHVLEKIALAHPHVVFTLHDEGKKKTYAPGQEVRLREIFGSDFLHHSFPIQDERNGYQVTGYLGLPTYHRASSDRQFFFVNNRPVKDKTLSSCLKAAFGDVTPRDRFPVGAIFLTVPVAEVDVNVHPAKTEVRFLDTQFLRGFVLSAFKQGLFLHGQRVSLNPLFQGSSPPPSSQPFPAAEAVDVVRPSVVHSFRPKVSYSAALREDFSSSLPPSVAAPPKPDLGQALGQIHQAYIVARNEKGLVLVDPHAAHERIVYEKMKAYWGDSTGPVRPFLISLPLAFGALELERLKRHQPIFETLGFHYEVKEGECMLKAIPEIFRAYEPQDILSDLVALGGEDQTPEFFVQQWRNHMMANWACRQSIKLGQMLSLPEMNALLRQIENTPHSAQCNHGRRVYQELSMKTLAQMFDRP